MVYSTYWKSTSGKYYSLGNARMINIRCKKHVTKQARLCKMTNALFIQANIDDQHIFIFTFSPYQNKETRIVPKAKATTSCWKSTIAYTL